MTTTLPGTNWIAIRVILPTPGRLIEVLTLDKRIETRTAERVDWANCGFSWWRYVT